jgi:hypothetical protein
MHCYRVVVHASGHFEPQVWRWYWPTWTTIGYAPSDVPLWCLSAGAAWELIENHRWQPPRQPKPQYQYVPPEPAELDPQNAVTRLDLPAIRRVAP